MSGQLTRRNVLAVAPLAIGMAPGSAGAGVPARTPPADLGFCLNTSTISGQKLPLEQVVEIAAQAGYQALEPWIRELDQYVESGRSLDDLAKRIRDRGLKVASAIGFFEWCVDDDARRKRALEQARRDMDRVRRIGGTRIAAPPVGATDRSDLDLRRIADRYRALLEIGDGLGVVPQVEVWGFSRTLGRLGDAVFVAIESGHAKACVLADVFHLYKGGSGTNGVRLLGPETMFVFHFNDYPANPPREQINDAQRVYPGDGVAPLKDLVRDLHAIGYHGVLSLELFNRDYWKQDPLEVARIGLDKMRAIVRSALP
jgi:sugar phosphate isomerase/epimerase